ncbi:PREDICTED: uncharacterized protein LOC105557922 [Vollenhovia emeryi]|uniref:uncharacterized protein LOC105557922 n=1 Tax=Vollenhovia emeryi TaxID=411798 RepID=UPI0005F4AE44|nr:PREDICTED: uncharacterized protein LOC105557922 [Vollenhovia emeryi]
MQKVEARKWMIHKESFDEYAIEKWTLIQRLNIPAPDAIQLIIGGIQQVSLRATALSLNSKTMEEFLEVMRRITDGATDWDRKNLANGAAKTKPKDGTCRNCGKKGHGAKDCKSEIICFYCKAPGHRSFDCPKLKSKDTNHGTATKTSTAKVAATVAANPAEGESVVMVQSTGTRLELENPYIKISDINGEQCNLLALIDGKSGVFHQIQYIPTIQRDIHEHETVKDRKFQTNVYILKGDPLESDLILGREFLASETLTLVYSPPGQGDKETVNLFACLPCYIDERRTNNERQIALENIETDADPETEKRLKLLILETQRKQLEQVEDGYAVKVNIKDDSVYVYTPRRFALAEKLEIRKITDDLLRRDIIQPSISPYCARVVPVIKKTGQTRLCVDLRPLNSRVEKQKYPFPIIEDCLSKISNKRYFTLLDMKDGFHQIKVTEDSTKYFSFATPDGQFECKRLPFGRFIKDYTIKAKPLQNLLKKTVDYKFDIECERAFETLKKELTSAPVLKLYDPAAETELHTDASSAGYGAILLQRRGNQPWAPVAYFSKSTNEAESKYHSYELEMLAIVKSIERFHLYLYG